MYSVFDHFLETGTWHTGHKNDSDRFNIALDRIVHNADFNADQLGEYIRRKVLCGPPIRDDAYNIAIDKLVANAWAVREYLEANGKL